MIMRMVTTDTLPSIDCSASFISSCHFGGAGRGLPVSMQCNIASRCSMLPLRGRASP